MTMMYAYWAFSLTYLDLVIYLGFESDDQPSRGPAVALTPPLLNSISASSRFKEAEWLLFSLRNNNVTVRLNCSKFISHRRHTHVLPAKKPPKAFGLLFDLWRRWQGSCIMGSLRRDAGQIQVFCSFTFCFSCKNDHINKTVNINYRRNWSPTHHRKQQKPVEATTTFTCVCL